VTVICGVGSTASRNGPQLKFNACTLVQPPNKYYYSSSLTCTVFFICNFFGRPALLTSIFTFYSNKAFSFPWPTLLSFSMGEKNVPLDNTRSTSVIFGDDNWAVCTRTTVEPHLHVCDSLLQATCSVHLRTVHSIYSTRRVEYQPIRLMVCGFQWPPGLNSVPSCIQATLHDITYVCIIVIYRTTQKHHIYPIPFTQQYLSPPRQPYPMGGTFVHSHTSMTYIYRETSLLYLPTPPPRFVL